MILRRVFLLFCIAILIIPASVIAQRKRGMQFAIVGDIGFTGGAGLALFRNEVLKDDNHISIKKLIPDYSYGGLGSLSFIGEKPGFTIFTVSSEIISNTAIPQITSIDAEGDGSNLYNKTINYQSTDLLFLGKITYFFGVDADKPIYLEGGIKYSALNKVKESNTIEHPDYYVNSSNYNPSVKYNDSYRSLVLGIGHYGDIVSLGLRCSYALEDITNGTDFMINDGVYNNLTINPDYASDYSQYTKTGFFTIELHLSITLSIIEIGRASCGGYFNRPFTLYKNGEYYW